MGAGRQRAKTGGTYTPVAVAGQRAIVCGVELEFHGELVGGFVGGGFGFGGEVEDEALEDEEFVGGAGEEFEVGAGYEADGAGEFAAGFVAAGLLDEVFGGEGGHAEALPQDLPDGAGVTDVLLGDDEHLAEGAGEHVEVADGRVFAAVGGVEEAVEEEEGAGESGSAVGVRSSFARYPTLCKLRKGWGTRIVVG